MDFFGKGGQWKRCVESWCETHHADPFREYLEGEYDGDDADDPHVWTEWFRQGYRLEGTHSDEYLAYAARWIIIPVHSPGLRTWGDSRHDNGPSRRRRNRKGPWPSRAVP